MIIAKPEYYNRNMKIVAVLSVLCLFMPLLYLDKPQGHLNFYTFIYFCGAALLAFIFIIMWIYRNAKITLTDEGLFISGFLDPAIPWQVLYSAGIDIIEMHRAPDASLLTLTFRDAHTQSGPIKSFNKTYHMGEKLHVCTINSFALKPDEIVKHINRYIQDAAH